MRRARKVDPEKEKYWRGVMARFVDSKMSFPKFCEQEKISRNTFQYWRRELRLRDEERGVRSPITKGQNVPRHTMEKTEYWLRVIDELNRYPGSVNQYLREHGLSGGSLWYWERRLVKEGRTQGVTVKHARDVLVPLTVIDAQGNPAGQSPPTPPVSLSVSDATRVEVRAPNGSVILFPSNVTADVLIQVVKGIGGSTC